MAKAKLRADYCVVSREPTGPQPPWWKFWAPAVLGPAKKRCFGDGAGPSRNYAASVTRKSGAVSVVTFNDRVIMRCQSGTCMMT